MTQPERDLLDEPYAEYEVEHRCSRCFVRATHLWNGLCLTCRIVRIDRSPPKLRGARRPRTR